jgi:hypothetical protein
MSTESETTPLAAEPEPVPQSDEPPVETDPPTPEPEPEEETETPPPPNQPGQIVVHVEPGTWYEVTSVCVTATCVNLNTTTTEPMAYSNAGDLRMLCGLCSQYRPILDYRKLDPQPEVS